MILHKSQPKKKSRIFLKFTTTILIGLSLTTGASVYAKPTFDTNLEEGNPVIEVPQGEGQVLETTSNRDNFDNTAERITADAALGDEIALLPGPNIDFKDLLRTIITWATQLAASFAILLFIYSAFTAINGSEDARNKFKGRMIKITIGLALIYFS